jgi:hypothetical protein
LNGLSSPFAFSSGGYFQKLVVIVISKKFSGSPDPLFYAFEDSQFFAREPDAVSHQLSRIASADQDCHCCRDAHL